MREARGDWIDEEHDPEGFALAAGAYGTCDDCGRPIPGGQLELRPARTRCVACTDARRR